MAKQLFVKGQSGNPAGRTPGSKNKFRFDVSEILNRWGCDPFKILIDLATKAKSEKVRCEAATELCGYVAPKLKSIELTGDSENPVIVKLNLGNDGNQLSSDKNGG